MSSLIPGLLPSGYIPCPMPSCGQPLRLVVMSETELTCGHAEGDLRGMPVREPRSWQICCTGGHILLLPPGDGQEVHVFGTCSCDPSFCDEMSCGRGDFSRLRDLIQLGA